VDSGTAIAAVAGTAATNAMARTVAIIALAALFINAEFIKTPHLSNLVSSA
jgi:hypothetical protein